ncbi:MAG: hypothetical protein IKQ24_09605 [Verrucomicrobia bacterium]|nr:hypothetical protein [Verrucomicrobiota bacterium]
MSQNADNRIKDESLDDLEENQHEVFVEMLSQAARKAGQEAVKKAFAMNLPIPVWKDGRIIKKYPDGREELVSEQSIK